MTLSDEEVFAEFRADGFDPEVVAAELRAHIEGLVAESGKSRLARARAGLAEARADRAASNVFHLPLSRKQEILRSEEHTSELQSLMRISYAVFCLKKKKKN